jgi:hypothetical protein
MRWDHVTSCETYVMDHVTSGIELCEGSCDLRERDMRGIM